MSYTEVLIGIQARSTSTRFPRKIYENIGGRRVLDWVIDAAKSSAKHTMQYSGQYPMRCQVAILYPEGDQGIIDAFTGSGCLMVAGSEHDVLDRYIKAQALIDADYVVRLTSDCPLILDFVITKHINVAVRNGFDYVSNVDENCRTVADGMDCEIMSRKMLKWLGVNASSTEDREHVTTAIRRERPQGFKRGLIQSKLDTSNMKISLDTAEDLNNIRSYFENKSHKAREAHRYYGHGCVYEL